MVVCKCRKATKLYCFVHKVPVCGDCICFPEHQICVVRTYSEWVIDGDYDWPPKCCCCHAVLTEGTDRETIRLGCLHAAHTNCFVSHFKSFPGHTAPDGYNCPVCWTSIWPPKSFKDSGSLLHSKLKESIMQTGLETNLFGNHPTPLHVADSRSPLVFASQPSIHAGNNENSTARPDNLDIIEIDGPSPTSSSSPNHEGNLLKSTPPAGPGATTRKSTMQVDRNNYESSYYANDEDSKRKYSKRGTMRYKFLRSLLPFWSGTLPILPVTAPPQKDNSRGDDVTDGHPRCPKTSRLDPRKILLVLAIMACVATMGILYYRIAQRGLGEELPDNDQP